jgi:hypothetical protein
MSVVGVRGEEVLGGVEMGSGTVRKSLCRVLGATRPCQCLERSLTGSRRWRRLLFRYISRPEGLIPVGRLLLHLFTLYRPRPSF